MAGCRRHPTKGEERRWLSQYHRVKEFVEEHGGQVPTQKTSVPLSAWVLRQAKAFRDDPLSPHWIWRRDMLSKIGVDITGARSRQHNKWTRSFLDLKSWMEANHGRRPTPKTNGKLATWLSAQRQSYKLTGEKPFWTERVDMLATLGIDITTLANTDMAKPMSTKRGETHKHEFIPARTNSQSAIAITSAKDAGIDKENSRKHASNDSMTAPQTSKYFTAEGKASRSSRVSINNKDVLAATKTEPQQPPSLGNETSATATENAGFNQKVSSSVVEKFTNSPTDSNSEGIVFTSPGRMKSISPLQDNKERAKDRASRLLLRASDHTVKQPSPAQKHGKGPVLGKDQFFTV